MLKRLKKYIYKEVRCSIYTGRGYIQGTGFDIETIEVSMFGGAIKFIKRISFSTGGQWLRTLKKRMEEDDTQQELERKRESK